MNDYSYEKGIAFIVEGATERVFYEEYLKKLCSERGMTITKDEKSQENKYTICAENRSILVLINNVGSVSQMTNSATWFHRACVKDTAISAGQCFCAMTRTPTIRTSPNSMKETG